MDFYSTLQFVSYNYLVNTLKVLLPTENIQIDKNGNLLFFQVNDTLPIKLLIPNLFTWAVIQKFKTLKILKSGENTAVQFDLTLDIRMIYNHNLSTEWETRTLSMKFI